MAFVEMSSASISSQSTPQSSRTSSSSHRRPQKTIASTTRLGTLKENGIVHREGGQDKIIKTKFVKKKSTTESFQFSPAKHKRRLERIRRVSEFIPPPEEEYAREEPLAKPIRPFAEEKLKATATSQHRRSRISTTSDRPSSNSSGSTSTSNDSKKEKKLANTSHSTQKDIGSNASVRKERSVLKGSKVVKEDALCRSPSTRSKRSNSSVSVRKERSMRSSILNIPNSKNSKDNGNCDDPCLLLPKKDGSGKIDSTPAKNKPIKNIMGQSKVQTVKSGNEALRKTKATSTPPKKSSSSRSCRSTIEPASFREILDPFKQSSPSTIEAHAETIESEDDGHDDLEKLNLLLTKTDYADYRLKKSHSHPLKSCNHTLSLQDQAEMSDDTCHEDNEMDFPITPSSTATATANKREKGLAVWFGDTPRATRHEYKDKREISAKWYSKTDLDNLLAYEIRINVLKTGGKKMSRHCCERGLERQLEQQRLEAENNGAHQTMQQRQKAYVEWVLSFQEFLNKNSTSLPKEQDPSDILRRKCRSKTKEDRKIAYRCGLQDAKEIQHIRQLDSQCDRVDAVLAEGTADQNATPLLSSILKTGKNYGIVSKNINSDRNSSCCNGYGNGNGSTGREIASQLKKSESMRGFLKKSFGSRSDHGNQQLQSYNRTSSAAGIANPLTTKGSTRPASFLTRMSSFSSTSTLE